MFKAEPLFKRKGRTSEVLPQEEKSEAKGQ